MEEENVVQKLVLKDFEGIESDPNGFRIDYLAAISKRALHILDGEKTIIMKINKGKRKQSDSEERDEQPSKKKRNKKAEEKKEDCEPEHLDEEQHSKEKTLEEKNKETVLDHQPTVAGVSKRMCPTGVFKKVISEETERRSMKHCSESVRIKRSEQSKKSEDCLQSNEEEFQEEQSPKRRRVKTTCVHDFQETNKKIKCKNVKKLDTAGHAPEPPPDLPREFMETLQKFAEGKSIEELKLVIQKGLFTTDVSKGHNRLSMPTSHLLCEFLTPDETAQLALHDGKNVKKIEVDIIEPSLQRSLVSLRRWEMRKESGNSSTSYVFSGTWNNIVSRNALRADQVVQVWSSRVDGKLCFLLVRLPKGGNKNPALTTTSVLPPPPPPPGNGNEAAGIVPPLDPPGPSPSPLEPEAAGTEPPLDPSSNPGPSSSSLEPEAAGTVPPLDPSSNQGPSSSSLEPEAAGTVPPLDPSS